MAWLSASSAVTKGCAARLWQSMQSITRRSPLGAAPFSADAAKTVSEPSALRFCTQGMLVRRRIGGDVLDVAQVNAVNPGQMGEAVQPAQVQHDHGLGLGVLFVVGKTRLHQQLFTNEAAPACGSPRRCTAPGAGSRTGDGIGVG